MFNLFDKIAGSSGGGEIVSGVIHQFETEVPGSIKVLKQVATGHLQDLATQAQEESSKQTRSEEPLVDTYGVECNRDEARHCIVHGHHVQLCPESIADLPEGGDAKCRA